jgi:NADH-quinone oxidoreductase subunit B
MLSRYRLSDRPEVEVAHLALACCSLEVDSAVAGGRLRSAEPQDPPAVHRALLVSGTVTQALAPAVEQAAQDLQATALIAFGVCASTGGPYWDSPTVMNGIDRVLEVTRYVPGCPPRPDALVWAIDEACA